VSDMTVKFGETRKIGWRVSTSLVDAVLDFRVKDSDGVLVDTAGDITIPDPPSGILYWQLSGTLPVGQYLVEARITRDGEVMYAPTIGQRTLTVEEALG
jgi:hypothetical protein